MSTFTDLQLADGTSVRFDTAPGEAPPAGTPDRALPAGAEYGDVPAGAPEGDLPDGMGHSVTVARGATAGPGRSRR
ncbi:hypothetical protein ABZ208_21600 [Streptomyces sp. NPDC006208]|uniref:hypothetical protein n=1 Tax=Streptomyces sp. NPDC006208 TaxID=3156734 RepID=UPI0033B40F08